MPGPPPKDPALRQRRNKTSTRAKLTADHSIEAPELPAREGQPWHPRTLEWWADVWASPMATEFLTADIHGLYLLAELEDAFHLAETPTMKIKLANEIRLQRQAFGLTPVDRRRLQWEIERTEDAKDRGRRRDRNRRGEEAAATPQPAGDPRLALVK